MENRPHIGIMVSTRSSRKSTLRLYQRYCDPNVKLFAFCPGDIMWTKRCILGLSPYKRSWKQQTFPLPQAVYNRCFNKKTVTIQRLEEAIGRDKCFNAINFFNKWSIYNLLKPSDVGSFVPDTQLYYREDLPGLLERYPLLFIKPLYGAMGKSVYRVEKMDNDDIHIAMHSLAAHAICGNVEETQKLLDKHLGDRVYVVQQGIYSSLIDGKHFDLRVLVQKNKDGQWAVSNIASRLAYKHYFNTAIWEAVYDAADMLPRIYEPTEMPGILQTLQATSIRAALTAEASMGLLGELSVDFIVDKQKKLWIIEMNGKPNKSIYASLSGYAFRKRIYRRPMEYACYLSQLERTDDSLQPQTKSPLLLPGEE